MGKLAYVAKLLGKGRLLTVLIAIALTTAGGTADAQKKGSVGKSAKSVKSGKPGSSGRAAGRAAKAKRVKSKPVDVNAEAAALVGADMERAMTAASRLGVARSNVALEALLNGLATGLHPKVAAAALDGVAVYASPKALDVVAFYLSHRDRRTRAAAVRAMGSIVDRRAVAHVLKALRDTQKDVRAAAVAVVGKRKLKDGIEPLMELLKKGDEAPAEALAAMASPDLALSLGELLGEAPDAVLARTLGLMLLRPSFKPEAARVQVVRTLGKISGAETVEQLTAYMDSVPAKPPRQSRREAEAIIEQRLTGGN